jgi:hypothetical protein
MNYFKYFLNSLKDHFYLIWLNKYNINPQGAFPVQAWGTLPTGEYYYFRSRGTGWSVRLVKNEKDLYDVDTASIFHYHENKYTWPDAGHLSDAEVIKYFNKAIEHYERSRT